MSCVIAICEDNVIYMGSDSQATGDDGSIRPIFCDKMIGNSGYVFGYTGSVRAGQVLKSATFFPPDNVNLIGESIRILYDEVGLTTDGDSGTLCFSNLIIGYEGKIYEMLLDFQINEPLHDYLAVGSGSVYAFGSLHSSSDMGLTPEQRLTLALDAAIEFDAMCGYPVVIRTFE